MKKENNSKDLNLTQTDNDSKTIVNHTVSMDRYVAGFRVSKQLKEAFKQFCKAKGLSECHVLEGLIYGYLHGVGEKLELVNKSATINLTLVRDVKRVRRYAIEEESEGRENQFCWYCLNPNGKKHRRVLAVGLFRYDKTGEVYGLCSFHAKALLESGGWSHV